MPKLKSIVKRILKQSESNIRGNQQFSMVQILLKTTQKLFELFR